MKYRHDPHEAKCEIGNQIIESLGLEPKNVRYAAITYHNGEQWTLREGWEMFDGDKWVSIESTDVGHRCGP